MFVWFLFLFHSSPAKNDVGELGGVHSTLVAAVADQQKPSSEQKEDDDEKALEDKNSENKTPALLVQRILTSPSGSLVCVCFVSSSCFNTG